MIKISIKEDTSLVNIYAVNLGVLQYIRETLTDTKGELNRNTVMVGNFNTSPAPNRPAFREKINKETCFICHIKPGGPNWYLMPLHPKRAEYMFFSSAHRTFTRIDHILGHKSSLSNFKKIEIISNIFYDFNAVRLHTNYRGKNIKTINTWRLKNMFLNDQEVNEEIKEEIKNRWHIKKKKPRNKWQR